MEFIRIKFSDEITRKRYNALPPEPNRDLNKEWAPFAWRTVRYLTKIEEGVDRLIIAALHGNDAPRSLADGLNTVFTFDQRLRIIERLLKVKRLKLVDADRRFRLPYGAGTEEEAIQAIRIAMRYRNLLFHNGVFLWVAGNDIGCIESLWVEVPDGYKYPTVPLIYRANDQPGLMHLAAELAMGLPFFFGSPIFQVVDGIAVDCKQVLEKAWAVKRKSQDKNQEKDQNRFDKLLRQLSG